MRSLRLKGSPAHVSAPAGPSIQPGIRPVIRAPSGRRPGPAAPAFLLPFSRRHSLFGHPVPPGTSAPLTVGLPPRLRIPAPARRTLTRFPRFTRMSPTGPDAFSTPGTAVLTRPCPFHGRRSPPHSGRSLPPRRTAPARNAGVTRHQQRFPGSRPIPVFPLAPVATMAGAAALGLFRELRTRPVRNRQRTSRRGQVEHKPVAMSPASAGPPRLAHSPRATSCRKRHHHRHQPRRQPHPAQPRAPRPRRLSCGGLSSGQGSPGLVSSAMTREPQCVLSGPAYCHLSCSDVISAED